MSWSSSGGGGGRQTGCEGVPVIPPGGTLMTPCREGLGVGGGVGGQA